MPYRALPHDTKHTYVGHGMLHSAVSLRAQEIFRIFSAHLEFIPFIYESCRTHIGHVMNMFDSPWLIYCFHEKAQFAMGGRMQHHLFWELKPQPCWRKVQASTKWTIFNWATQGQGRSRRQHILTLITLKFRSRESPRLVSHCLFCINLWNLKKGREGKAGLQSSCRSLFHFFWLSSFRCLHRHARNDRVNRLNEGIQCCPCEQNHHVWDFFLADFLHFSAVQCSSTSMNFYDFPSASPC